MVKAQKLNNLKNFQKKKINKNNQKIKNNNLKLNFNKIKNK